MPRKESKFVDSYFGKPWIQPYLATFDLKKAEYVVTPGHAVAQIIKIKEGCAESLGERAENIYGSADLHDSFVRANAVFTTEAIEEFEKYEEAISGCEFEHLPFSILVLKKFHIIPQITERLCDCNLVICIEEFNLVVNEEPMHNISSLPWAKATCSVTFNLHRLWSTAHGDCNEASGSEALTNSDATFSGGDLSQLLAEVKKDLSLLHSSHSAEDSQMTVASQSQVSPIVGPVTDETNREQGTGQQDPGPSELSSQSNHHTPDKSRDSPHGRRDEGESPGCTAEGRRENGEENLKWRHVHQLASWVFKIHPTSFHSSSAGDAGQDRMEEVVKQVTRCMEKLPDQDELAGDEDGESSCEKDGTKSQDFDTKQASPVSKSPFSCKRKSRRGKRRSPLAQKPGVLRGDSHGAEGQDREEQLLFEKISKELPTTVLITLAPEDIVPLPNDYDLGDDDDDDDCFSLFSDVNNNIHLQEWDRDCTEVEQQPLNTNLNSPLSSAEGSKHVASSSTPPAKTASKDLFPEPVHPPEVEQSLQSVLQEIDELFDNHSAELLNKDASMERGGMVQDPTKTDHSPTAVPHSASFDSSKENHVVHTSTKRHLSRSMEKEGDILAQTKTNNSPIVAQPRSEFPGDSTGNREVGVVVTPTKRPALPKVRASIPSDQETVVRDSVDESESQEEQSEFARGDSVTRVERSSLDDDDDDDDETQLPTSPLAYQKSPVATASSQSAVKKCLMPSKTSAPILSDSRQSHFILDTSGESDCDFTELWCSIDERMQKEHTTDGTGDHKQNDGFGSDSDIFILSEECTEVHTQTTSCPEVAEIHSDVSVLPKESLRLSCEVTKGESNNSRNSKLTADNSIRERECGGDGELRGDSGKSRKRKQRILSGDSDKKSTEKRIRFAEPEPRSVFLDESLVIDSIPSGDGHSVWTSTQKDGKDATMQEAAFRISSEEEASERESFDTPVSSGNSLAVCLSGWVSKQDMMSKHKTAPGVETIKENDAEVTDATNTGMDGKQNSSEDSVILLSSGSQMVGSCPADTQENNVLAINHSHSLVNSTPLEGSARDSDRTINLSVTPVLFSSEESTKATNPDAAQPQNQMPSDKTGMVKDSRVVGESSAFDGTHHSYDHEEPMNIDTPDDSLPFNPGDNAFEKAADNLNLSKDKFSIRIRRVSGRCNVQETQPDSPSVPPDNHSTRPSTPPGKVTKSLVQTQNVVSVKAQELAQVYPDGNTSKLPERKQETAKLSIVETGTNHQVQDVSLEQRKMTKNLTDDPKFQTTQSVQSSKIYMGPIQMRRLIGKKKTKLPVAQTTPSRKSENVINMKHGPDTQTTLNPCLPPGQTSRKLQSVVERRTTKEASMDTSGVSFSDVRTPCLRKSSTSGKASGSTTRPSIQTDRSEDKSDSSSKHTVSTTKASRNDCTDNRRKRSGNRRKKVGYHVHDDAEAMSPEFSRHSQDQDENLASSQNESLLNGTSLPSSDDSRSTLEEQALLDWCATYLINSSNR